MPIASHDWTALSRLLDTALSLPPEQRASWVEHLDGEGVPLKAVLSRLLARQDLLETGGFLATFPRLAGAPASLRADVAAGDEIGPYRLERALGIGGMGSVWLAERTDGLLKRQVALKLPHLIGGSRELAERMARERDILAALEHPRIARLYDAGIAADGRPWLALEYVEGRPIDAYCREHGLSIRARVDLVLQVTRAVAYAHAHLVVHRDLKPTNILVDATGCVRLLDFGIAKLLDPATVAAGAQPTQFGGAALTPEYASPEQVRGGAVSTASDVYSLGVVFYELLCGERPYKLSKTGDALSLAQAIVATEPPRPSDAATARAIRRQLRGDLDTIVLKTLKKAPPERYATVAELADDLERHTRGEPVRARPDSFWYRTRKFVGRNKLGVGAVGAVLVALCVGLGLTLWEARMLRVEERTSSAVEQFLENIFRANSNDQPDPSHARQTTVRELLKSGAKMVDESLEDAPEARLRMLATLAQMHNDLQLWDEAVVLNRKGVELAHSLYGREDPRVVDSMIDLSLSMVGSQFNAERGKLLEEAVRILDRDGDTASFRRGRLLGELSSYYTEHDLPRSLQYAEQSVQLLRRFPPSSDLMESLVLQGWLLGMMHRDRQAEAVLSEAIETSEVAQGEGNAHLPRLYGYLAEPQSRLQEFAAAEESLRKGWALAKRLKGETDAEALQVEMRLGMFLVRTSRVQEGIAHTAHASAAIEQLRGAEDPLYTQEIQEMHGRALCNAGRAGEGLPYLTRVTRIWQKYRPRSNYLMAVLEEQAAARVETGDLAGARELLDEEARIGEETGNLNPNFNGDVVTRIRLLLASDLAEDAAQALEDLQLPPDDAPGSLVAMRTALLRAEVELARGRADEARRIAARTYGLVTQNPRRGYLQVYEARAALDLGKALHRIGQHAQSLALLKSAVDLHARIYGDTPWLADALVALGDCLLDLRRLDEARAAASRARAIHAAIGELGPQYRRPLAALQTRLRAGSRPVRSP